MMKPKSVSSIEANQITMKVTTKLPGIFLHFGVYSSISFGSEWFWTNWKDQKIPSYVDFMKNTQKPSFTYQVITGNIGQLYGKSSYFEFQMN